MRISSGPSRRNEKPRSALSSWGAASLSCGPPCWAAARRQCRALAAGAVTHRCAMLGIAPRFPDLEHRAEADKCDIACDLGVFLERLGQDDSAFTVHR